MSRNPTEHVQEEITHHASHETGGRWITAAATTAAIIAAFAAAAGALATRHETQSTLIRIKANDDWSYYQAKSIKSSLLEARDGHVLLAVGWALLGAGSCTDRPSWRRGRAFIVRLCAVGLGGSMLLTELFRALLTSSWVR